MICENIKCKKEHDGTYGYGRFCGNFCSHSRNFSKKSRIKIGVSTKAVKKTDVWKENISIANKGRKMSMAQMENRRKSGYNFSENRNKR